MRKENREKKGKGEGKGKVGGGKWKGQREEGGGKKDLPPADPFACESDTSRM